MKRTVSILLAILLTATLAMPAFAEAEDPAAASLMPHFVYDREVDQEIEWSGDREAHYLLTGTQAWIDSGDPVGYELYCNGEKVTEFTDTPYLTQDNVSGDYYVIAYNSAKPEYRVQSNTFKVTFEPFSLQALVRYIAKEKIEYPAGKTLFNLWFGYHMIAHLIPLLIEALVYRFSNAR